jgi:hypothetical protein
VPARSVMSPSNWPNAKPKSMPPATTRSPTPHYRDVCVGGIVVRTANTVGMMIAGLVGGAIGALPYRNRVADSST